MCYSNTILGQKHTFTAAFQLISFTKINYRTTGCLFFTSLQQLDFFVTVTFEK